MHLEIERTEYLGENLSINFYEDDIVEVVFLCDYLNVFNISSTITETVKVVGRELVRSDTNRTFIILNCEKLLGVDSCAFGAVIHTKREMDKHFRFCTQFYCINIRESILIVYQRLGGAEIFGDFLIHCHSFGDAIARIRTKREALCL